MTTSRCLCLSCGQKLEFPDTMIGARYICPTCGKKTILKAAYQPRPASIDAIANRIFAGCVLVGVTGCVIYGCVSDNQPGSSYRRTMESFDAKQEQIKANEDAIRNGDKLIYGNIRVESEEDIHKEAKEWQKEQEQGIGQPYR